MLVLSHPAADLPPAEIAALQAEALANLAGPFALFAADGRLVSANRQMARLLPAEDAAYGAGASLERMLAAIGHHGAALNQSLPQPATWLPKPGEAEHAATWRGADGVWFRMHLARMQHGFVLSATEVTELKQEAEALAAARTTLETVFDHMTDGVVMWDAEMKLQFFNKETLRVGEFPLHMAYKGASVLEVMRYQDRRGEFGPPPNDEAELEARVQGRAALLNRPGGISYMRQTPSGMWLEIKTIPVQGGGTVLMYRDITTLKQREEELATARRTHEVIMDSMNDGLMLWSADLRVRLCNPQLARFYLIPELLTRPGADGRDILRMMIRRGDYGAVPAEGGAMEAMVEDKAQAIIAPTGGTDFRLSAGGFWMEITRQKLADGSVLSSYRNVTRLKLREAE